MSSLSHDLHARNQLASDWMHQGIDLAQDASSATLEKAIRCFDEAIALRRTLPLEENPFYRYGLSAGWINRGDALARLEGDGLWAEAIKSYDEALALLETLPLEENVLYPRRLAITWINRGIALQKQGLPNEMWEAVDCFREAIGVLEHLSATRIEDRPALLAGAWTNLACALTSSGEDDAEGIRAAAHQALRLTGPRERTDLLMAEMGLKTRHVVCRLALKTIAEKKPLSPAVIAETTDAVDEAMTLARHWNAPSRATLAQPVRDLFRFGCRIYAESQPHFLAEFLMETLSATTSGRVVFVDEEIFQAAQTSIWSALAKFQFEGFHYISTPRFEPFLAEIEELRQAEDRLKQFRFFL